MPTISTILDNIRAKVIDVPSDTEARLEGWVQEAQLNIEASIPWLQSSKKHTVDTVAGVRDLGDTPADWIAPVGNPYYLSGDGEPVGMEWLADWEDARKQYGEQTGTGYRSAPKALLLVAYGSDSVLYQIYVYPLPDASNVIGAFSTAGEYEIHIPYDSRASTLVDGGDQENIFTEDPHLALYLEDYAAGKAMLFNRDYDNAQVSLVQAQAHLLRAKRIAKRNRAGQRIKFTPRRDVHASRRQYRRQ